MQAIHWLDNSPWRGAINPRYSRGLVFETLWHVIMGQQPVMEDPEKKECQVYDCQLPATEVKAQLGSAAHSRAGAGVS